MKKKMPQTNEEIIEFLQKNGFEDIEELVFRPFSTIFHPESDSSGIDIYEAWYRGGGGYEVVELHVEYGEVVGIVVYDQTTGDILASFGRVWNTDEWVLE